MPETIMERAKAAAAKPVTKMPEPEALIYADSKKNHTPLSFVLQSGLTVTGYVTMWGSYTVTVRTNCGALPKLIYKNAIAYVEYPGIPEQEQRK